MQDKMWKHAEAHPREFIRVQFLEPLGLVQWGVDLIAALPEDPVLMAELVNGTTGSVPVVGIEGLVLMKLRASRAQDVADVEALVRAGADVAA